MTLISKRLFLAAFILVVCFGANADSLDFEPVDLTLAKKQIIEHQKPLVLYVSHTTCPFCKQLDKEIMSAVLNSKAYTDKVLVQKLVWDSFIRVNWIDEKPTLPNDIVTFYKIRATPTLLFIDENGNEIAKRIEGYRGADFYWVYLDKSIEQARQHLKGI